MMTHRGFIIYPLLFFLDNPSRLWYNKTDDLARLENPNFRAQKETIMKRKTNGFHHLALKCVNEKHFDDTVHFYRDLLGMETVRTWYDANNHPCTMLDTGSGVLEIFSTGGTPLHSAYNGVSGALNHIAFAVDDVDDCIETVRSAGYLVTVEPKDICIPSNPPYPARIGFCIGPVGEEIEFFQEK